MDGNGNLTARGTDGFTYDQANRLKTASVGGTASAYSYDGDGKRSSKTVGGTPTSYTYDVNASLPVLLDDGTRKYVWGLGLAFAVDASGSPLVYHTDGLGSVRALTDPSGTVAQSYLYDEYGNVLSSTGSITQPFQYTGEQRDAETGLLYLRARYYDSGTGTLVSRDRLFGERSDPATLHRYAYAHDNPTNLIDPTGLSAGERQERSDLLPEEIVALRFQPTRWQNWQSQTSEKLKLVDRSGGRGGGRIFHLDYEVYRTEGNQLVPGRGWHFNADTGPFEMYNEKPVLEVVKPVAVYLLSQAEGAMASAGQALSRVGFPVPVILPEFMLDPLWREKIPVVS